MSSETDVKKANTAVSGNNEKELGAQSSTAAAAAAAAKKALSAAAPVFIPRLNPDANVFVPGAGFKPSSGGPSFSPTPSLPATPQHQQLAPQHRHSLSAGPSISTSHPPINHKPPVVRASLNPPHQPKAYASQPYHDSNKAGGDRVSKQQGFVPKAKPTEVDSHAASADEISNNTNTKAAASQQEEEKRKQKEATTERPSLKPHDAQVPSSSLPSSSASVETTTTESLSKSSTPNGEIKPDEGGKSTEGEQASSSWRRGVSVAEQEQRSSPSGGGPTAVAPVPLKASSRTSSAVEWESGGSGSELESLGATIPDVPLVEGTQQYFIRDLIKIRKEIIEKKGTNNLQGTPPVKPEGCEIPTEILNTEPLGLSPLVCPPTPAPPDLPNSRSRTPKIPDGLPRPRSAGLGFGDGSGSGSGRSTPRERDMDVPSFSRQSSRGSGFGDEGGGGGRRKGNKGGGRRGGYREPSPPPTFEDQDGYAPKRIDEGKRWKAESLLLRGSGGYMDVDDPEKKIKRARAILNKLSLEKFDKLSVEFLNVGFNSEELLSRAVDIIVNKAQEEVHFSSMYAELCLCLSRTPMEGLGETEKGKKFRKILLMRCQEEFYTDLSTRLEAFDKDSSLGDEDREEKKRIAKFRYLGHMRFIGELFLKELLKEEHVHDCIKELFGEEDNPDEEKLACLCKLLSTTGKKLELLAEVNAETSKKQKRMLDKYFKEVKELSESKDKLSSRTRCLLKDLYELRQNSYVPRRAVETAKTLSQVHEEVAREQQAKAAAKGGGGVRNSHRNNSSASLTNSGGSQDVRRDRSSTSLSSMADDDGWETVGARKSNNNLSKTSGTSNRNLPRSSSNKSMGLKRGGSSSSFGSFSVLQQDAEGKKKKDGNSRKEKREPKEHSLGSNNNNNSSSSSSSSGRAGAAPPPPPSSSSSSSSSGGAVAVASKDGDINEVEAEQQAERRPPLSEKDLARKGKSVLADYLELRDDKEAVECMKELKLSPQEDEEAVEKITRVVGDWVDHVLQRKEEQCLLLSQLLAVLHKECLIPSSCIGEGFNATLEVLADTKVDTPKADVWLAKVFSRLLESGALPLTYLQNLPEQMIQDGCAADFVLLVFSQIKQDFGTEKAKELMEAAGLDLRPLLGPDVEDPELEAQKMLESLAL